MDYNPQAKDVYDMVFKDKVKARKNFLLLFKPKIFFLNYFAVLQNGFFVEAGAASCDFDSVTLPFELHLNWTGKALPTLYQEREWERSTYEVGLAVLRIRITLMRIQMRIQIRLITLMRIRM
jgi:hypothetical protein